MNDLATLAEAIEFDTQVVQYSLISKVRVMEHMRLLRGRNQAHLVMGEDGKYYAHKLHWLGGAFQ
jgi:hypothetical protein